VLYGIAAALPIMKQQKSGHFINVSSVAGHKVGPGSAVYAATKFAVRALSEGLRQEVKPYNTRTTVISPGAVATELPNSVTDPEAADRIRKFSAAAAIPADSFARTVALPKRRLPRWYASHLLRGMAKRLHGSLDREDGHRKALELETRLPGTAI
jgi:NADP-dependent 3-hydroxy acid dehydrogenase YdfG